MPWWGWVIIGVVALAIFIPLKIKITKKILRKRSPGEEESKEDF